MRKRERELEQEIKDTIFSKPHEYSYHNDIAQTAIAEGVYRIKNKLQSARFSGKLEEELQNKELIALAENENVESKLTAEFLKSLYTTPEVPKDSMIDDRISHYYELQKHKLEREERRKRRKEKQ